VWCECGYWWCRYGVGEFIGVGVMLGALALVCKGVLVWHLCARALVASIDECWLSVGMGVCMGSCHCQ
jgi:hypothetical protein